MVDGAIAIFRPGRILLGLLVLGSALFAAWSLTTWAPAGPASPRGEAPDSSTPAVTSGAPSIDEGRRSLASGHPRLASLVDAVEASDTEATLAFLSWVTMTCDKLMYRGVDACERQGLAKGTVLELFAMEGFEGAFPRDDVRAAIDYDLAGRHPRLALVAERDDGSVILFFLLDARPDLVFPGGRPAGGPNQVAVLFGTTAADPEVVTVYDHKYEGSPPLEFLRYDEHRGIGHTVLGVSTELEALERSWHEEHERQKAR